MQVTFCRSTLLIHVAPLRHGSLPQKLGLQGGVVVSGFVVVVVVVGVVVVGVVVVGVVVDGVVVVGVVVDGVVVVGVVGVATLWAPMVEEAKTLYLV